MWTAQWITDLNNKAPLATACYFQGKYLQSTNNNDPEKKKKEAIIIYNIFIQNFDTTIRIHWNTMFYQRDAARQYQSQDDPFKCWMVDHQQCRFSKQKPQMCHVGR